MPFSTISDSNEFLDSTSLIEDYCGDIASPLSMLETHRSNNGGSHMTRISHPIVAHLGGIQTPMKCKMWDPELNGFLRVSSNTPADSVRGIFSTGATESSDLSFLYNAGDSHLDCSTSFDTGLIEGIAAWSDGLWKGDHTGLTEGIAAWSDELWKGGRQQPKTFSIYPRNEAEAQAVVKKMLRACGKVPQGLIGTTAELSISSHLSC